MTRFGVYEELKIHFSNTSNSHSSIALLSMACTAGLLGGIAGNPADVINVRMQSDMGLPPSQRRHYKHAFDGLYRMVRHEGMESLLRGVVPNSTRAVLMTASQLTTYDIFKRLCIKSLGMKDNLITHSTSSFLAGLVATTVCSPADVIKTRIMSASASEVHKRSMLQTIVDISRVEGISWAFRGWVPSFMRLGPHTITMFIFLEQHRKLYRYFKGIPEPEHH